MAAGDQAGGGVGGVAPAGGDGHAGTGATQREHDGRGAAGAGDEHVGAGGVEALVAHRAEEAFAVGRRARQPTVVLHGDHVDGREGGGVGGEVVARPRRVGLVRHGDGEAGRWRACAPFTTSPPPPGTGTRVDPIEPGLAVRGVEDCRRT